jgi:hypothetical protein
VNIFSPEGTGPYAGLSTPSPHLPSILPWGESTDLIEACGPSEVFLGVSNDGTSVTADLDVESPHILVSAGTGGGKSAIARSVATQRLMKGDIVVFLDVKQHSHRWAKRLAPNVHYAPTVPAIGRALVDLGRELHRRNTVIDQWDGPVETAPVGPRIIVVFEEVNATMRQLADMDRGRRSQGEYLAGDGFRDLTFMGRAARMHQVAFAQLATFRAMGGSEIVENFAHRVMIRYSPQAWKWLASDCGRPRTAPAEIGRGMVVQSGRARETQLVWLEEAEAASSVLASIPAQKRARELCGGNVRNVPPVWRTAIGR